MQTDLPISVASVSPVALAAAASPPPSHPDAELLTIVDEAMRLQAEYDALENRADDLHEKIEAMHPMPEPARPRKDDYDWGDSRIRIYDGEFMPDSIEFMRTESFMVRRGRALVRDEWRFNRAAEVVAAWDACMAQRERTGASLGLPALEARRRAVLAALNRAQDRVFDLPFVTLEGAAAVMRIAIANGSEPHADDDRLRSVTEHERFVLCRLADLAGEVGVGAAAPIGAPHFV